MYEQQLWKLLTTTTLAQVALVNLLLHYCFCNLEQKTWRTARFLSPNSSTTLLSMFEGNQCASLLFGNLLIAVSMEMRRLELLTSAVQGQRSPI
jgi:hypothetical protein